MSPAVLLRLSRGLALGVGFEPLQKTQVGEAGFRAAAVVVAEASAVLLRDEAARSAAAACSCDVRAESCPAGVVGKDSAFVAAVDLAACWDTLVAVVAWALEERRANSCLADSAAFAHKDRAAC